MSELWPWLAAAGVGVLHGLSPSSGWPLAAAWGFFHARGPSRALRAWLPLALGHLLSVALVAALVVTGLAIDRRLLLGLAAGLLIVVVMLHLSRSGGARRLPVGSLGLGLCSFMMATAHGAGLMLVPALVSLCVADAPGRGGSASGHLALALAALLVHTAAMLLSAAAISLGVCRGLQALAGRRG